MFPKLLIVLVFLAAVAATLLTLRQRRLDMMHQMTALTRQIDHVRQTTWGLQTRIAQQTDPQSVRAAAQRAQIALRPVMPVLPQPAPRELAPNERRVARANY